MSKAGNGITRGEIECRNIGCQLRIIAPYLTEQDVQTLSKNCSKSLTEVSAQLKGKVKNADTGRMVFRAAKELIALKLIQD